MLQLVRVLSVPKEHKLLVRNDISNQKIKFLSDFKTKFLQRFIFQIKFFTTRQIIKQNFHNVSDFKSKVLQRVRFVLNFFKKNQILNKNIHSKNHVVTEVTP